MLPSREVRAQGVYVLHALDGLGLIHQLGHVLVPLKVTKPYKAREIVGNWPRGEVCRIGRGRNPTKLAETPKNRGPAEGCKS